MSDEILLQLIDPRDGRYNPNRVPAGEAAEIKRLEVNAAAVTDQTHERLVTEQWPKLPHIDRKGSPA